ncbi:MAG: hypothetical protein NTW03_05135 [Verrucomicrobia bacterium]|nr:hypothetical protein [Verrucomicrobiota bacterium]
MKNWPLQNNLPGCLGLAGMMMCLGHGAMGLAAADPTSAMVYQTNYVSGGNGNGLIDRRECNSLNIVLSNASDAPCTGLYAILGTTTPGVEITQPASAYPDLPRGATGTNGTPFSISTSALFHGGTAIDFMLTITSAGGGTNLVHFTQNTPTNGVDGGGTCPMVLSGSFSCATDPLQAGPVWGDWVTKTCGSTPTCPGVLAFGPRIYNAYILENLSGLDNCVTVEVSTGCDPDYQPVFGIVYLDSFNPNDPCENYWSDIGAVPALDAPQQCSFVVPAGHQFIIVIHDPSWDPTCGCTNYTLTVSSEQGFIQYRPRLHLRSRQAHSFVFSWSASASDYGLESAPSLGAAPGAFARETNALPVMVGPNFFLTVTNANVPPEPSRYYRLRKL